MRVEHLSAADLERRTRLRRAKAFATGLLLFAAVVYLLRAADRRRRCRVGGVRRGGGRGGDDRRARRLVRGDRALPPPARAADPAHRPDPHPQGRPRVQPAVVRLRQLPVGGGRARAAGPGRGHRADRGLAGRPGERAHRRQRDRHRASGAPSRCSATTTSARWPSRRSGTRLRDAEVGPVLGRLLGQIVEDGSHHQLVDVVADRSADWLRLHEDAVLRVVQRQAPPWSPEFVDRALARKLHAELVRIADDVAADPRHPVRLALDDYLASVSRDLREDPDTDQRVREVAERLMQHDATREALGSLVGSTRLRRAQARGRAEQRAAAHDRGGDRSPRPQAAVRPADARQGRRLGRLGRRARRRHVPGPDHERRSATPSSCGTARRPPAGSSWWPAATCSSSG